MNVETLTFITVLSGSLIGILLVIVGFFLKIVHSDVKSNTEAVGKNKGKIELVAMKQETDNKRLEELTQLELKVMSEKVGELSTNVSLLVQVMIKEKQNG